MFRLSIVTENNFAVLGMIAKSEFFRVMESQELDTVQEIDDNFLERVASMKATSISKDGFTEEFKASFLEMLKEEKGKKCFLTHSWLTKREDKDTQMYMKIVSFLNQGKTLQEAINLYKETETEIKN